MQFYKGTKWVNIFTHIVSVKLVKQMNNLVNIRTKWTKVKFKIKSFFSGQLELRSSGGAGEFQGAWLGLYQLLPDGGEGGNQGPVYRQLHDGDNGQYYLFRWDELQLNVCHTVVIECILT